jgi:restriction system protein
MIPDYQSLMLPVLRFAEDGKEHRFGELLEPLGKQFGLTEAEMTQLLSSGKQTVFNNRVHWAKTYLAQAKLLENTRHGHFRLTERGREVLRESPARVDVPFLHRFTEFNEFKERSRASQNPIRDKLPNATPVGPNAVEAEDTTNATPDELLRATVADLEAALSSELLERILAASPAFFEGLIVTLLLGMGYGGSREEAGRAIGKSGDGGIDGVIDQDPLGLDRVYLQAKRYSADLGVSEPEIRGFSGSLGAVKASKGVFVTTSYFTKPAIEFAERHPFKMVLIDGKLLTALMLRYNVGVRVAETLHVKKLDEDFFGEE